MDCLQKGRVDKPCTVGFNYFFIRSSGDVYPCPLIDHRIGNIQDTSLERLIHSKEAALFRKISGTHDECRTCTERDWRDTHCLSKA